jgi:hypothetical protein
MQAYGEVQDCFGTVLGWLWPHGPWAHRETRHGEHPHLLVGIVIAITSRPPPPARESLTLVAEGVGSSVLKTFFLKGVEVLELTLHDDIYLVMGVRDSKGEAGEP